MRVYAEPADVGDTPPDDPDDTARRLRRASRMVDEYAVTARYRTDDGGYPADPDVRAAFRDAVVEQVRVWASLGVDPSLGAADVTSRPQVASKSLGSGSVSYQASDRATADKVAAVMELSDGARDHLDGVLTDRVIGVHG